MEEGLGALPRHCEEHSATKQSSSCLVRNDGSLSPRNYVERAAERKPIPSCESLQRERARRGRARTYWRIRSVLLAGGRFSSRRADVRQRWLWPVPRQRPCRHAAKVERLGTAYIQVRSRIAQAPAKPRRAGEPTAKRLRGHVNGGNPPARRPTRPIRAARRTWNRQRNTGSAKEFDAASRSGRYLSQTTCADIGGFPRFGRKLNDSETLSISPQAGSRVDKTKSMRTRQARNAALSISPRAPSPSSPSAVARPV